MLVIFNKRYIYKKIERHNNSRWCGFCIICNKYADDVRTHIKCHNPNQINPNQINPNQINPNQINPNSINPNSINPNSINPNKINPNQINIINGKDKSIYIRIKNKIMYIVLIINFFAISVYRYVYKNYACK